ncbi:MAG: NAD(P)/FAD-dependent oxidoreductase [Acholeplasmatales bacterium]|nr:NAD(P)/FAD-dependent oxidoreductase [Acholeplasmatales bacterium]
MIGIIGAGASGLMLANKLSMNKIEYQIFERDKAGRKILASGNGRCNLSNANLDMLSYHNNPLSDVIIKNKDLLLDMFSKLKIYHKTDSEGRMYPISESSSSVLNILLKNVNDKIIYHEVKNITKKANGYYLDEYGPFDDIVICTGSPASFKDNKKPSYEYLKSLDLKFNEFKPSLVGFKTKLKIKDISGVRSKSNVSLYVDNKLIHSEDGEVIFKDDGISGICIMNLSSYYNKTNKANAYVKINLVSEDYDDYESVLNPKLLKYVMDNKIDVHNFIIPIYSTYEMEFAQVAAGGIDVSMVNPDFSLKTDNHIYVAGEVIDIDGVCGGYNLASAFISGLIIGEKLCTK